MVLDFIIDNLVKNSQKEAVIFKGKVYKYSYILEKYNNWLEYVDTNIGKNEVVAIQSEYNPQSIALLLALIQRKCIIAPFSPQNINIEKKLKVAEANYFFKFTDDKYVLTKFDHKNHHEFINTLVERDTSGIIIFSSGSTGEAKAALHDFSFLLNKFKVKRKTLRTINFLLFDHWGGLNTLLYILSNAGVIAIPNERTPEYICKFIEKYQIELLPTTPTFLNLLLLSDSFVKYNLSSLKMISYGTEPMLESTLKAVYKALPFVEFKQTYGLTELGVFRTKSKGSDSLWLKVGGEDYQTKIIDGVLFVKAKTSIIGYLNAASPFDEKGWYNTGDRVEVDGEWIRFLGRTSDIINVGGQKVFPAEVESVLMQIEQIKDCVVYGEKNAIMGNVVAVDIVLKEKIENSQIKTIIRQFCKDKLDNYKTPVRINIVGETSIGERFKKIRTRKS